ncbi:hypothetical protein AB1M95_12270 [Sulfitobacter sp. LCG007]
MYRIAAVALAALLPITAQAQQVFKSVNRLSVVPLSQTSFEVIERSDSGVRDIWCAGGDYVRHVLGDPRRARIFLIRRSGPAQTVNGRRGTTFTISPEAAGNPGPSFSASITTTGTNLSANQAQTFCRDVLEEKLGF